MRSWNRDRSWRPLLRRLVAGFAVLMTAACSGNGGGSRCARSPVAEGSPAEEIIAIVERGMAELGLLAVLFRVTVGDEEIVTAALGESEPGVPARTEMHFRNGAVALSYLTTLLLQQVDRGVVRLDDPVGNWMPELPASDRITLRMLANTTSGYVDYVTQEEFLDRLYADPFRRWTVEELRELVVTKPLLYEPGTNWSYSHLNFVLLGEALERATGTPVRRLMRDDFLRPLDLRETRSSDGPNIPKPVLHAFTTERGFFEDSTFWNPSWTTARGAIMTTDICDMATGARTVGRGTLLSETSREEQVAPTTVGIGGPTEECPFCRMNLPDRYYALGIVVLNGWLIQNPVFAGYTGAQGYLPSQDLTISVAATFGEEAEPGPNYANALLVEIARLLSPDQLPQ